MEYEINENRKKTIISCWNGNQRTNERFVCVFVSHFPQSPHSLWQQTENLNEQKENDPFQTKEARYAISLCFGIHTGKRFAIHHIKINYSEFSQNERKFTSTLFKEKASFSSTIFLLLHKIHCVSFCLGASQTLWKMKIRRKKIPHSQRTIRRYTHKHNLTPFASKEKCFA